MYSVAPTPPDPPPPAADPDPSDRPIHRLIAQLKAEVDQFIATYPQPLATLSPERLAIALGQFEDLQTQLRGIEPRYCADSQAAGANESDPFVPGSNWGGHRASAPDFGILLACHHRLSFFSQQLMQLPTATLGLSDPASPLAPYQAYVTRLGHLPAPTLTAELAIHSHRSQQAYHAAMVAHAPAIERFREAATPEQRLAAYQALTQSLEPHQSTFAQLLGQWQVKATQLARSWDYADLPAACLAAQTLPEAVAEAVLDASRDRHDLFQRFYRLKGRALGRVLRTCDWYLPWSGPEAEPTLTPTQVTSLILGAVRPLGAAYREATEQILQQEISFALPSTQGAWQSKPTWLQWPAPLTYPQVFGLARQVGEQVQHLRQQEQRPLNQWAPGPWQAIAAHLNQLLLLQYLQEQEDPGAIAPVIGQQLEQILHHVFQGARLTQLELLLAQEVNWQFGATPTSETLTSETLANPVSAELPAAWLNEFLNETWLRLTQDLCGDAVELLVEHQSHWLGQAHLFGQPLQGLGQLVSWMIALALWGQVQQEAKVVAPSIWQMLATGDGQPLLTHLQPVALDLCDPNIAEQAIAQLEDPLEFLEDHLR